MTTAELSRDSVAASPVLRLYRHWQLSHQQRVEPDTNRTTDMVYRKLARAVPTPNTSPLDLTAEAIVEALSKRTDGTPILRSSASIYLARFQVFWRWVAEHSAEELDRRIHNGHLSDGTEIERARAAVRYLEGIGKKLRKLRPAPSSPKLKHSLSDDDVRRIVASAHGKGSAAIITLLAVSGLRVGELVALKRPDLKKNNGQYCILVQGKERANGQQETKTRRQREVPLDMGMVETFLHAVNRLESIKDEQAVYFLVRRAAAKVGLHVSPHDLRHYAAQRLLKRNTPLHLIQKFLGHTDLGTTLKYLRIDGTTDEEMRKTAMTL